MPASDAGSQQQRRESKSAIALRVWAEARRSIFYGLLVLTVALAVFAAFIKSMPRFKDEELKLLVANFPPKGLHEVKALRDTLLNYADTYPVTVAAALSMLYVMMQSFVIPGTISLSLLSGALFGPYYGLVLVVVVSTLGSSSCYSMSWAFGKPLVKAIWPDRLTAYSKEITKRKKDLLSYIIFLRVTPILPNTFINVASPIVDVPLFHFVLGTFIGCLPNNFMAVKAGDHLSELESLSDLYDPKLIALGLAVGVVALVPVYLSHRHERQQANQAKQE